MATVNYYIKGAISDDRIEILKSNDNSWLQSELKVPRQIYLKLSTTGDRLQIYTGKRISQAMWNKSKQEIDTRKYRNGGVKLNKWLTDLKNDVLQLATDNELNSERTLTEDIKEILSKKKLNKPSATSFEDYINQFLSLQKTGDGYSLKSNTIKKYEGFHNHIIGFSLKTGVSLELSRLDKRFLNDFKDYLSKTKKLSDNTVAKYVKAAKTFIRFYVARGLIKPFDISEIKSKEREGEIFVLPIKQIIELQNHQFKSSALSRARDVFCFMCWTGQRYSDITNLTRKQLCLNDHKEAIWKLVTVKTNENISVPIISYAEEIMAKYEKEEYPIPRFTNQKLNFHLKTIGEKAEINNLVKVVKYYDGRKVEDHVPFYKVLTTHVARKSYITNSLILGVPERVVREVSGHKDEKSFRRYVNLAESYSNNMVQAAYSTENLKQFLKST